MNVVVNDTNIFIDLYSVCLLNDFFKLPIQIHTVDFVINEITDKSQKQALQPFINNKQLFVKTHSSEELQQIDAFKSSCKGNVSVTDCAVWQYALINKYVLLTGDRQLFNSASKSGVSVCGILFIINKLVENNIITKLDAAEKLELLYQINKRLPKREVEEMIGHWRKSL